MKYLILIAYAPSMWVDVPAEVQERFHEQHLAFHQRVGEQLLAGEALADNDTATTLRRGGQRDESLTDGPFAETAEMIGGFYLVEADDLDQVVAWCRLLPPEYSLEIRPCIRIDGFE